MSESIKNQSAYMDHKDVEVTSEAENVNESQDIRGSDEISKAEYGCVKAVVNDKEDLMEDIPVNDDLNANHPHDNDTALNKSADISVKVQSLKDWGYNTFIRTKQKVKEKLSRSTKTVDADLEDRIELIKLQQTQYRVMLGNNNRMVEQLKQNILLHQFSSRMFAELAQTDKILSGAFIAQSQTELLAADNFKELIEKLTTSTNTLETLVTKTFDDMLLGIQAFETARVEYDAFNAETLKLASQMEQKKSSSSSDIAKLQDMQERLDQKRARYETSRSSVLIKLDLLDDNKTRVIQREILNFRHAWFTLHSHSSDLFSGDKTIIIAPEHKTKGSVESH